MVIWSVFVREYFSIKDLFFGLRIYLYVDGSEFDPEIDYKMFSIFTNKKINKKLVKFINILRNRRALAKSRICPMKSGFTLTRKRINCAHTVTLKNSREWWIFSRSRLTLHSISSKYISEI